MATALLAEGADGLTGGRRRARRRTPRSPAACGGCPRAGRAGPPTGWRAASLEPAAASTSASSSRHPRGLERLAHPYVEHLEEATASRPRIDVARTCSPRVPRVGLGDGGRDVDLRVVGLGQQQGTTTTSSTCGTRELVHDRVEGRLGQLEERGLDPEVRAQRADLVDERLDRRRRSAGHGFREPGPPVQERPSARPPLVVHLRCRATDDAVDHVLGLEAGHQWIPHSVLAVPAHRPLRGSSPGATRRVHGAQPMDG